VLGVELGDAQKGRKKLNSLRRRKRERGPEPRRKSAKRVWGKCRNYFSGTERKEELG